MELELLYDFGTLMRIVRINKEEHYAEVVTDEEGKKEIIHEFHSSVTGGHSSESKSVEKIREKF